MNPGSPAILQAASFDWEALLPILFFLLYGIAQFFGSKKKSEQEEDIPVEEDGPDPVERARQVREEIQRKIRERLDAAGSDTDPTQGQHPQVRPPYDPTVPENRAPSSPSTAHSSHDRQPASREAVDTGMGGGIPIEERLRRQQERLRQARKRQQEARQKARSMEERAGAYRNRRNPQPVRRESASHDLVRPADLRQQVIEGVRDPNALRRAILYQEILGTPVSLRRHSPGSIQAGPQP